MKEVNYEELLDGYNRTFNLIKHIDPKSYNQICMVIDNIKENKKEEFEQFVRLLKRYVDDDNVNFRNVLLNYELQVDSYDADKYLFGGQYYCSIEFMEYDFIIINVEKVKPFNMGGKTISYMLTPLIKYQVDNMENEEDYTFLTIEKIAHSKLNKGVVEETLDYLIHKDIEGKMYISKGEKTPKKLNTNLLK